MGSRRGALPAETAEAYSPAVNLPPPVASAPVIRGRYGLLLVQSIVLAIVLAWPAPARLAEAAIGTAGADVAKHVWNLWWARAELREGPPGLLTTLVNWPRGMPLYPIEPINQAIAAVVPLPPVLLSNLLALLHLVLVGLCAGWLGWFASGSRLGALVTAALFQGSSFVAFTLHAGVGELRQAWWIPLGLGCLLRARHTRETRWFVALGLTMAGATLACFYHGFFLAAAVLLHVVATMRWERRLLVGYASAGAITVAIVLPVVTTFADSYGPASAPRPDLWTWLTSPFQVNTYAGAALDLPDLVRSRVGERGADRLLHAYTGGRYIGAVAFALALAGLWAARRRAFPWVVVALGGIVLSMGTVFWWRNEIVALPFALPLLWINRLLAWVAEPINFPVRFLAIVAAAVAVLAGMAAARWRWAALLAPVALVDVVKHDLVPWPRDMTALPTDDGDAPPGAVADLSPMIAGNGTLPSYGTREGAVLPSWIDPTLRARGIVAQIALDRPFQTVAVERQQMWALEGLLWTATLPLADALVTGILAPEEAAESTWLLRARGFGSVVLTHACGEAPDPTAAAVLDAALGPRRPGRCHTLWALPTTDDAGRAETWAANQATRAQRLKPPRLRTAHEAGLAPAGSE